MNIAYIFLFLLFCSYRCQDLGPNQKENSKRQLVTCAAYQYLQGSNCIDCSDLFIGCERCTSTQCTSCMDGLYFVVDQNQCVFDCSYVTISATDTNQSPYYADNYNRQCLRCGQNCQLCKDDVGCLDCLSSSDASKSFYLQTTSGVGSCQACSTSLDSCLLCSDSSTCTVRDSKVLATGVACSDSNCRVCTTDSTVCNYCKSGYVLVGSSCQTKSCTVSNCLDCPSSTDTTCTTCGAGYFLASSTSCTACSSNCAQCSSSSTCTLCNTGYVLTTTGTCALSCGANSYKLERVNPPVFDIFEKKSCQVSACSSTCATCLGNNSAANMCTSCNLGSYLSASGTAGTCVSQTVKPDSNEIILYVSNLPADISRAESLQTGDIATPFVDLMKAIKVAYQKGVVYSTKADGTIVVVRIALFIGDHYILRKKYDNSNGLMFKISKNMNFKITISPYFCSLVSSPDTSKCVSSSTSVTNVYVKIGQEFYFLLPQSLEVDNILFDFSDSIIPYYDDPGNCLITRARCCYVDLSSGENMKQITTGQTETCTLRRIPRTSNYYFNLNYMFIMPNVDATNNGVLITPSIIFQQTTIQNILFEFGGMFMYMNSGSITLTNCKLTALSSQGSIFSTYFYQFYNYNNDPTKTAYIKAAILKPSIPSSSNNCEATQTCRSLSVTGTEFSNFFIFQAYSQYVWKLDFQSNSYQKGIIVDHNSLSTTADKDFSMMFDSCNFFNIKMRYTQANLMCKTIQISSLSSVQTSLPNIHLIMSFYSSGDLIMIGNTFTDVFFLGNFIYKFQKNPVKYFKNLIIKNTFLRVTRFSSYFIKISNAMTSALASSTNAATMMSRLTTSTDTPCTHFVFDQNSFTLVGGTYRTYSILDINCATYGSTGIYGVSVTSAYRSLSDSSVPVSSFSITSQGITYTYDLNKNIITNNAFDRVFSMVTGLIRYVAGFRIIFNNNSFQKIGPYSEILFRQMNSAFISPGSLCRDYAKQQRLDVNPTIAYIQTDRAWNFYASGITIDQPRYYTPSLDKRKDALFASSTRSFGTYTVSQITLTNAQGLLGDFNTNTLQLKSVMGIKYDEDSIYMTRMFYIDNTNFISTLTIDQLSVSNAIVRSNNVNLSTFVLDVKRSSTNVPSASSFVVSKFTANGIYCFDYCGMFNFQTPSVFSDSSFKNIGTTAPFKSYGLKTQMTCVQVITKPDEVIQFNNVLFQNIYSTSVPTVLKITKSSLTGTQISGYNAVLGGITITGNTINQPLIDLTNFSGGMVQFLSLNFNGNTITGSYPCIQIGSGANCVIQDSQFSNNIGTATAQDFYVTGFSTGSLQFINTVFTGKGISTYSDLTTYNMKPAIKIENSKNIAFTGCTMSGYPKSLLGGAVSITGSTVTFTGTTLKNNQAKAGGGMYISSSSSVTLTSCTFIGNQAEQGAAFYLAETSNLVSSSCTISGNTAKNSGAFQIMNNCIFSDSKSTIQGNTATDEGSIGLISNCQGSNVFDGTNFLSNSLSGSSKKGKGLYIFSSNIAFKNATISKNFSPTEIKNLYLISSTLTITNCTFVDDATLYTSAQSLLVTGGFLYMYSSTVTITTSNFNSGIGGSGAAIFSVMGTLSVATSSFVGNVALSFGGGIYTTSNKLTTITTSTFTNNQAPKGDSIYIEFSEGSDSVTGCTFNSNSNPAFIHLSAAIVTVDSCTFQQLAGNDPSTLSSTVLASLKKGSGISLMGKTKAVITNCNFKNILTDYGTISITENIRQSTQSTVQYTIKSNTFQSNIAYSTEGGAGIQLSNPINADIESNTFISNNAFQGDGGAIKFTCANTYCIATITLNTFTGNIAQTRGGAISWDKVEPISILVNTFTNNKAKVYGNNIGSLGETIVVISQSVYQSNYNTLGDISPISGNLRRQLGSYTVTDHQSGTAIQNLYIAIVDKYGYIVKYGTTNKIEPKAVYDSKNKYIAALTGNKSYLPLNGCAIVSGLIFTATPNTTQTVQFTSTDLRDPSNTLDLTVKCRACTSGEEFTSIGSCQKCAAPNYYLIEPPVVETPCLDCPAYANCFGGASIYPKSNYWKAPGQKGGFYPCYVNGACVEAKEGETSNCETGYQGIMCDDCVPGYSRTGDFNCSKCPVLGLNIFITFVTLSGLMIYIIIIVYSTLNSANTSKTKLNCVMRMMINHVQLMLIISALKMNWPSNVDSLLSSTSSISNISTQLISFDCFIDQRNADGTGENKIPLLYSRLIIAVTIPILVIVVSFIFWHIRFLIESRHLKFEDLSDRFEIRELRNIRDSKVTTTNIVILFLIHPTIVRVMFDMLNCDTIEGETRLVKDINTICYKGSHLYMVIFLTIPSIIVWGFGIPISAVRLLRLSKDKLDTEEVQLTLGYIYSGYTYKAYYWEEYIMIRKMLLIFVSTFFATKGKLFQALVILILLALFCVYHTSSQPFQSIILNRLELYSLFASFITIYAGYFFMAGVPASEMTSTSYNDFVLYDEVGLAFFILILVFQCVFFASWIHQMYILLKRSVEMKHEELYKRIFLCTKSPEKLLKYEQQKKKREFRERAEEILDKLIDNYEYLWELKSSGEARFENEFDYFVVRTLSGFQKIDFRSAKEVLAERQNPDLPPKRKTDNKIIPIDETLNKLNEDVEMSIAKFTKKHKKEMTIKQKEKTPTAKKLFSEGLFQKPKRKRRRLVEGEVDEDVEYEGFKAIQKFVDDYMSKVPKVEKKVEEVQDSYDSDYDSVEDRKGKARSLAEMIRDIGIRSLERKKQARLNEKRKKNRGNQKIERHVRFGKIEGLVEEEKVLPFANGSNINDVTNNGLGISLMEQENLNEIMNGINSTSDNVQRTENMKVTYDNFMKDEEEP